MASWVQHMRGRLTKHWETLFKSCVTIYTEPHRDHWIFMDVRRIIRQPNLTSDPLKIEKLASDTNAWLHPGNDHSSRCQMSIATLIIFGGIFKRVLRATGRKSGFPHCADSCDFTLYPGQILMHPRFFSTIWGYTGGHIGFSGAYISGVIWSIEMCNTWIITKFGLRISFRTIQMQFSDICSC